jgi:FkbM family methyltransferase
MSLAERQFYASIIPEGLGSILDVGANAGAKTEIFRHFAERVVAIEPDPTSAQTLRRRFGWRLGVTVRQCAITSESGSILFYQFAPGSAFNTADTAWAKSMVDGSNYMGLRLPQPKEIRVRAHTIAEIEAEFRLIKLSQGRCRGARGEGYINAEQTCPTHQLGAQFSANV